MKIAFVVLVLLGVFGWIGSSEQTTVDHGHKQSIMLVAEGGDGYNDGGGGGDGGTGG